MSKSTTMPVEADTQELLTVWYGSQIAEGNKPSWHDFKKENDGGDEPLGKEVLLSLFNALSRERDTGSMGRTLLGDALREGVPEPEELERDILIKGAAHQIFTGPGNGKTWLALWLIKRAIERKQRVMFFDMENGTRIITERLKDLGVGLDVDKFLFYYPFPEFGTEAYYTSIYRTELDTIDPALIFFDSWVGCLGACGMDENSNTDVEVWANAYVHPAKARGCTVGILDHVGHNDTDRSRAASRKKDVVDVQWNLKKVQDFSRTTVGEIKLTLKKDRDGWLPPRVTFSIGGTPEGFIMERSEGTIDNPGGDLKPSERAALDTLDTYGNAGAGYEEWRTSIPWKGDVGMPRTTFLKAREHLMTLSFIALEGDTYFATSHHITSTSAVQSDVGQEPHHITSSPLEGDVSEVDDVPFKGNESGKEWVEGNTPPHDVPIAGGCIHEPETNSKPGGCAECRKALSEQLLMV